MAPPAISHTKPSGVSFSWLLFLSAAFIPLALVTQTEFGAQWLEQAKVFSLGANPVVNIRAELGPQLSTAASIVLPQDEGWHGHTGRWSLFSAPTFSAVIEVASDQDVQSTVQWATEHKLPYLVIGGHHGTNKRLGGLKNGVGISFTKLKGIELSADGNSATLGVGLKSGELARGLSAFNKRTPHGACLCTGIMGPLLGGGYGFLSGQHGLMADNLLEARVVLADGSLVTANEQNEHKDLFWALRGAGHNFGIVTSVKMKVHDQPARNWTMLNIAYPGAMAEKVFAASNEFNKELHEGINNFIVMRRIPPMNPKDAVILVRFFFDGPLDVLQQQITPFTKVPQMFNKTESGGPVDIFTIGGSDEKSFQCKGDNYKAGFGVELEDEYDPKLSAKIYNFFNDYMKENMWASNSNLIFETYGNQAVEAVSVEKTAVPSRKKATHIPIQIIYEDDKFSAQAVEFGKKLREMVRSHSPKADKPKSYVNYAFGDEPAEVMYGYDEWRLEKLRKLKAKYDPEGKFSYYAPVSA